MKLLTKKLKEYLNERQISHREFAKMLNVDHSTVTKILNEERNLGYDVARKFVYALGAIEASKLIDWEGMKIEQPKL